MDHDSQSSDESDVDTEPLEAGEYEVERLIGIRWVGDSKSDPEEEDDDEEGADELKLPNTSKKEQPELATNKGLEFKVGSLWLFMIDPNPSNLTCRRPEHSWLVDCVLFCIHSQTNYCDDEFILFWCH